MSTSQRAIDESVPMGTDRVASQQVTAESNPARAKDVFDEEDKDIPWETVPVQNDPLRNSSYKGSFTPPNSHPTSADNDNKWHRLDVTPPSVTLRFFYHCAHQLYTNPYLMLGYSLLLTGMTLNTVSSLSRILWAFVASPRIWILVGAPLFSSMYLFQIHIRLHIWWEELLAHVHTILFLSSSSRASDKHNNVDELQVIDQTIVKCVHAVGVLLNVVPVLLDVHTLWVVRDTICRGLDAMQIGVYLSLLSCYLFWSVLPPLLARSKHDEREHLAVVWSQQLKKAKLVLHTLALHGALQLFRRQQSLSSDGGHAYNPVQTLWNLQHVLALVLISFGSCLISLRHWYVVLPEGNGDSEEIPGSNNVVWRKKEDWATTCIRTATRLTLRDVIYEVGEQQRHFFMQVVGEDSINSEELDQGVMLQLAMLRWIVDYWGHTNQSSSSSRRSERPSSTSANSAFQSSYEGNSSAHQYSAAGAAPSATDDSCAHEYIQAAGEGQDEAFGWDEMSAMLSTTTDMMLHETVQHIPSPSTVDASPGNDVRTSHESNPPIGESNIELDSTQVPSEARAASPGPSPVLTFQEMLSSFDVDENARPAVQTYRRFVYKLPPSREVAFGLALVKRVPSILSLLLFVVFGVIPTTWWLLGGMIVLLPLCGLEVLSVQEWVAVCNSSYGTAASLEQCKRKKTTEASSESSQGFEFMKKKALILPPDMDAVTILFSSVVARGGSSNDSVTTPSSSVYLRQHTLTQVYRNLECSAHALEVGLLVTRAVQTTALAAEFANSLHSLSCLGQEVYHRGWIHGLSIVFQEYLHYAQIQHEEQQQEDHHHTRAITSAGSHKRLMLTNTSRSGIDTLTVVHGNNEPRASTGQYATAARTAIRSSQLVAHNVKRIQEEHPQVWNSVVAASEPVGNVAMSAVGRGWLWGKEGNDSSVELEAEADGEGEGCCAQTSGGDFSGSQDEAKLENEGLLGSENTDSPVEQDAREERRAESTSPLPMTVLSASQTLDHYVQDMEYSAPPQTALEKDTGDASADQAPALICAKERDDNISDDTASGKEALISDAKISADQEVPVKENPRDPSEEDKWMYIHRSSSPSSDRSGTGTDESDDNWLTLTPTDSSMPMSAPPRTHAVVEAASDCNYDTAPSQVMDPLAVASRLMTTATSRAKSRNNRISSSTCESNANNAEWGKWVGGGLAIVGAALAGAVSIHGKMNEEQRAQNLKKGGGSSVQIEELPDDDVADDKINDKAMTQEGSEA
jgi:hypothetical protein